MPWRHALFATSYLLNLHANSSKQYHVITCSFQVPAPNFLSKCRRPIYLTSVDGNLMCRGPLSEVYSRLIINLRNFDCVGNTKCLQKTLQSWSQRLATHGKKVH